VNRLPTNIAVALAVLFLVALLPAADAAAQQKTLKEQLVGTWTFVSSTTKLPDGSPSFGSDPKGLIILRRMVAIPTRSIAPISPRFASKNRLQGTPDENKAVVQGSVSSFGTYSVNDADKTLTLQYEASSFPNLAGTQSTWSVTIAGAEVKFSTTTSTAGTGAGLDVVYKRAK
jgi:Lipocalin-like domain